VTRYLLDTNIVSETLKPRPAPAITNWLENQNDDDLFIASYTLAEIWRGVLTSPEGRRRRALERWFSGSEGPPALFRGRILPFDETAAVAWGRVIAEGQATGRPRSPLDMLIAATAIVNGCVVVTGNERHFQGIVELLNPVNI
jgi:predicted nucleic acid-binding protein